MQDWTRRVTVISKQSMQTTHVKDKIRQGRSDSGGIDVTKRDMVDLNSYGGKLWQNTYNLLVPMWIKLRTQQ